MFTFGFNNQESNPFISKANFGNSLSAAQLEDIRKHEKEIEENMSYLQMRYSCFYSNTTGDFSHMRDKVLGRKIGLPKANFNNTGVDLSNEDETVFMEVKSLGAYGDNKMHKINAIFEDSSTDKASYFKDPRILVGIGISGIMNEVGFAIVGEARSLSEDMEYFVNCFDEKFCKDNNLSFRSGPCKKGRKQFTVSFSSLINKYGFKIMCLDWSREKTLNYIKAQGHSIKKITDDNFITREEFKEKYSLV